MGKFIKICGNHEDYPVPLIWTFAFNGSEYWCPYCGFNGGMFGTGKNVESTKGLKNRLELFEAFVESSKNRSELFEAFVESSE